MVHVQPFRVYPEDWVPSLDQVLWFWKWWRADGAVMLLRATPPRQFHIVVAQEQHLIPWDQGGGGWASYGVTVSFIERALSKVVPPGGAERPCADQAFVRNYPALAEFVSLGVLPDGTTRETSTINVSFSHGTFKAFLNDRDSLQSLCVTAETFQGLLEALEGQLQSDSPGWRPLGGPGGKKGKKA